MVCGKKSPAAPQPPPCAKTHRRSMFHNGKNRVQKHSVPCEESSSWTIQSRVLKNTGISGLALLGSEAPVASIVSRMAYLLNHVITIQNSLHEGGQMEPETGHYLGYHPGLVQKTGLEVKGPQSEEVFLGTRGNTGHRG
ncbi:hypothetical protein LEMLEM_LOCUS12286 [Lemmus lemmus]